MTKRLGSGKRTGGKAAGARGRAAASRRPARSAPAPVAGDRADEGRTEAQTDRLRYLDAATRSIARGMDLDETLSELCRAAVPAFADTALVHLYDPLPVGDETGPVPGVLRLHTTQPTPSQALASAAEAVHPAVGGPLATRLRDGRPIFGDARTRPPRWPNCWARRTHPGRCRPAGA